MSTIERPTELEKRVIEIFLEDVKVGPLGEELNTALIAVLFREIGGSGFLTKLELSPVLKLFDDEVSMRWNRLNGWITLAKIEVGFLVYVDNGYLRAVEGYTFGEEWPTSVEVFGGFQLSGG
jgi:hypothetical protein